MKRFLLGIAVLSAASLSLGAEELSLRPINRAPLSNEAWCGKFFAVQTLSGAAEKQINFAYAQGDSVKRDSVPASRAEVVIREGESVVSKESGEIEIRFSLGRAKYDEARACLPPPVTPAPPPEE